MLQPTPNPLAYSTVRRCLFSRSASSLNSFRPIHSSNCLHGVSNDAVSSVGAASPRQNAVLSRHPSGSSVQPPISYGLTVALQAAMASEPLNRHIYPPVSSQSRQDKPYRLRKILPKASASAESRLHRRLAELLKQSIRRRPDSRPAYTPKDLQLLRDYHASPEVVDAWARLLLCTDPEKAAEELLALSNNCPPFVFLLVFKRQDHTPRSLRYLLRFSLLQVRGFGTDERLPPWLRTRTLSLMTTRLAQRARRIVPALLPEIASLMHSPTSEEATQPLSYERLQQNNIYNHLLVEFARRSDTSPMTNALYNTRAQMIILKKMTSFKPDLLISRTGFRALVATHQALPKTDRERLWAKVKSTEWPPWKTDRTSADSELGFQDGISTSHKLILQSENAGFPARQWEQAARILSGWDTDMTPTHQSRHLHDARELSMAAAPASINCINNASQDYENSESIWAARVKSTRTADESWDVFMSYLEQRKNAMDTKRIDQVYSELISKIQQDNIREARAQRSDRSRSHSNDDQQLPGDSPKVFARSPTLRRDPNFPTVKNVADMMIRPGDEPVSLRAVSVAIKTAIHPAEGLGHFRKALGGHTKFDKELQSGIFTEATLKQIPDGYLSALIVLFCRFQTSFQQNLVKHRSWHFPFGNQKANNFITSAVKLILAWRTQLPGPWLNVLNSLSFLNLKLFHIEGEQLAALRMRNHLASYEYAQELHNTMLQEKIVFQTGHFHYFCQCYSKALLAAHLQLLYRRDDTRDRLHKIWLDSSSLDSQVKMLRQGGLPPLLTAFQNLTGQDFQGYPNTEHQSALTDKDGTLVLLQVPSLEALQALIQALGIAGQFDSLLELLRWILLNEDAIYGAAKVERSASGFEKLKKNLVHAAAFFCDVPRDENTLLRPNVSGMWNPPDDETREQIKAAVMELDGGSTWPTLRESLDYGLQSATAKAHRKWLTMVAYTFPESEGEQTRLSRYGIQCNVDTQVGSR